MRRSWRGVTSSRTVRAGGSSARVRTSWPQTTSPPSSRRWATSASMIACEPPRGSGQPTMWPSAAISNPYPAVVSRSSGSIACAATPASSPRARWPRKRALASGAAARMALRPKLASSRGCRGSRSGSRTASARSSPSRASGPSSRCQAAPSSPSEPAVASSERSSTAAEPSSSGWASAAGGCTISRPWRSSGSPRRNGEASASGWTAEQTSWWKPERVSSAVRQPPPAVAPASSTRTERPALARTIAAASPLGPAPTTTASGSLPLTRLLVLLAARGPAERPKWRAERVERGADAGVVPDVAGVGPLALAVDADHGGGHRRVGHAEVAGEVGDRLLPEAILPALDHDRHAQLVQGVVGAQQDLHLRRGDAVPLARGGAEGDPAGEDVPLRGHEGERLLVGVQDQEPGGQLDDAADREVEQGHVAWGDAGERAVEAAGRRPEAAERLLPGGDHLHGGGLDPGQLDAVGLLP